MEKAIIHTETRVIRRTTTEENPQITADETVIEMPEVVQLGGGFWKLNAKNKKVAATVEEGRAAGIDYEWNNEQKRTRIVEMRGLITELSNDATIPAKLRDYFKALDNLNKL